MCKNIVFISFKYPPEYSGYGKQLKSVISCMNELNHGFKFTLLTAYKSSKNEENKFLRIVPLGVNFFKNKGIFFYLFCLKVMVWLILNRKKYSIIHCIKAGPEAVVANIASKIFKKKLIVKVAQDELSDREIKSVSGLKRLSRRGRHYLLRNVDNFIAISEEIKNNIEAIARKNTNIVRIPNGVDDKRFFPVNNQIKKDIRSELDLPQEHVIILFVGSITKRKGIIDLLNAVKKLESKKKCTLVICGPILEDINVEYRIKKINKSEKHNIDIVYRGNINNVEDYMKAADIFVLPSYSEGLPNVLLEAAVSGLALIATDIGGNRDIIKDGINGFLVPVNTSSALANKIDALVDDKQLRLNMGNEAIKHIHSRFTLEHVSNMYKQLYKNLLK